MSSSEAPAPERPERVREARTVRGEERGTPPSADREAPLWLLAGVEQDEGPEPHIRRGLD